MIRKADIADFEKVLAIEKQIFDLHSNARPDMIDKGKSLFSFEYFKKIIEDEDCNIFVYVEGNVIMGFCITQIQHIKDHPILFDMTILGIEDLCVDEKHQGKGIGRALVEATVRYAKEKGIKRIELSVWDFNKRAIAFYEHLGMNTKTRKMQLEIE